MDVELAAGPIFHVCRREEWESAVAVGLYGGSSQDQEDGFIHCSSATQVVRSAHKHRVGQTGLVLLVIDPASAHLGGERLRWEPSRSGKLYPHVYGGLHTEAVTAVHDLPLGDDDRHRFPPDLSPT